MELKEFTRTIIPLRAELIIQARKSCGDNDTAEDLVQEVMLKLWSMRNSLDSNNNNKALAFSILKNKNIDLWRHRQLEMKGNDNDMNNISYNESFERNDEFGIINMIIDKLPPLQSEILKMKEIDGYEAEEIMEITGCTYDSLRQNLSRARRKIRDEYLRISKIKVK